MYAYFTTESQTNFKTKGIFPHFLKRLDELGTKAKQIYTFLLEKLEINMFHNSCKTGHITKKYGSYRIEDGDNVYVEVSRSVIAEEFGYALGTVRECIKNLARHGLLVDVRVGINKVNKIFLRYAVDAKYTFTKTELVQEEVIETSDDIKMQEKSDEEAATPSSHNDLENTLNQVRTIVSQITDESLVDKDCKNLLKKAKGDDVNEKLLDLQRAVEDCYGIEPTHSYLRMLYDRLRNRHHEKKPKIQNNIESPQKKSTKKKNSFSEGMYKHDWDLEELEKRASDYMEKTLYGEE